MSLKETNSHQSMTGQEKNKYGGTGHGTNGRGTRDRRGTPAERTEHSKISESISNALHVASSKRDGKGRYYY